jgi:hemoglobin-like flavoprotein
VDVDRLKASFRRIATYGDQFPSFFYAHLFLTCPQAREMFPSSMEAQRRHLGEALARIVASAGHADDLIAYLTQLGITHRRFGVEHDGSHYEAVGSSLVAALRYFEGHEWTPELATDWAEA